MSVCGILFLLWSNVILFVYCLSLFDVFFIVIVRFVILNIDLLFILLLKVMIWSIEYFNLWYNVLIVLFFEMFLVINFKKNGLFVVVFILLLNILFKLILVFVIFVI